MAAWLEGGRNEEKVVFSLGVSTPEEMQPLLGMLSEEEKLGRKVPTALSFLTVSPISGNCIEAY